MSSENQNYKTILVVDDEVLITTLLEKLITKAGYNVIKASSGNEAFKIFQENKIHLVISDVRMPGGDGIELLSNIKALDSNIPVVMHTGFANHREDEIRELGVAKILTKPCPIHLLLSTIESLVGNDSPASKTA